jgi:toxin ParE1/3/4
MAHRLIWSPRSASHLEEICNYIAEDSPVYARIFARNIIGIVKTIPPFPNTGRVVPEYKDPDLREKIYSDYRIVYRIKPDTIEVVAICHGARLLSHVLPDPEA